MTEVSTKLAELKRIVDELDRELRYVAPDAIGKPAEYARRVNNVVLQPQYGGSTDDMKPAIDAIRIHAVSAERRRGEIDRDNVLRAVAVKLETLRAILPSLAVDAAIELGVAARELDPDNRGNR